MKKFYDKKDNIWEGISKSEAKERGITPKNIEGDVFCKRKGKPVGRLEKRGIDGSEKILLVYPFKEKLSAFEQVEGYIHYEGDSYVRVVRSRKGRVLAPLIILLLLLAGAAAWLLLREKGPDLDKTAVSYEMPEGAVNTDPSQLMLPYFDSLTLDAEGNGNAVLVNPEGNRSYFKYSLTLNDTGEILYESGLIEPGKAVTEWKTEKRLEPGEYKAILNIYTFSLDDPETKTNGGGSEVTLYVKE